MYIQLGMTKKGPNSTSMLISIRLPIAKLEKLKAVAAVEGIGYQTILKRFMDEGLSRTPAPPEAVLIDIHAKTEAKRVEKEIRRALTPKPDPKPPPLPGGVTDDELDKMMSEIDIE